MANNWRDVPEIRRQDIYLRWIEGKTSVGNLAEELKINPTTLSRRLREMRQFKNKPTGENQALQQVFLEIMGLLHKGPQTMKVLSDRFDRSEATIRSWINQMREQGYCILAEDIGVETDAPKIALGEEPLVEKQNSQMIRFGVFSDTHFGSIYSQPSSLNQFLREAVDDGVQTFFMPGDVTAGLYGYRGQDLDLVPSARPRSRSLAYDASLYQSKLANFCWPQFPGVNYYTLGGNHDYWHVIHSGIDVVQNLAESRPDIYFLGYDQADIALTDNVRARLWHPSGGVPYATCLSDDSQILTKRGWIGYQKINMSDEIATLNPNTSELEYQRPQRLFIENYQGEMVSFQNKVVDHLVTPQHDLWVRPYNEAKNTGIWRKVPAKDLLDSKRQAWQLRMNGGNWTGVEQDTFSIPFHQWSGARDLGEIPMDAFLTFLGWYISEGHIQNEKAVCITQLEGPNVDSIVACMRSIGLSTKVYAHASYLQKKTGNIVRTVRAKGYNGSLCRWLKQHAGSGAANKRVPRFIMELSPRQIKLFLSALFAGDGTKDFSKPLGYSGLRSISPGLLDDVQELLIKIGLAGVIRSDDTVSVYSKGMPNLPIPKRVEYKGIIWCVQVPNGLVLARRNGKAIWTGNSYRVQKGLDTLALENLNNILDQGLPNPIRFLFAGHLHVQGTLLRGGMIAAQVGCFEGQTNYLRRKALIPVIAGEIWTIWFDDAGRLDKYEHVIKPYAEIENDWARWDYLDETRELGEADQVGTLFRLEES